MKPVLILLILLSSAAMLRAQIINGGFEDGMTGWTGRTGEVVINNPHSGNFSFHASGEPPVHTLTILKNNSRSENQGGSKIPPGRQVLSCWYKMLLEGSDEKMLLQCGISHNGIGTSSGVLAPLEANTWTKLSFDFDSKDSISEDSLSINFLLLIYGQPSGYYTLDVDDFQFDTIKAGINSSVVTTRCLSISPNPISSHAHLNLHLNNPASIRAAIYDVTGREVLRLPSLESAGGDESIPFDVDEIPNGMYYLRCEISGHVMIEKIIVNH